MKNSLKIHPIVFIIALILLFKIGYGVYENNVKIESQLQKHLNNWVQENGGERYRNAVELSIISVTEDYATGCKRYKCSFITIVKDSKGDFEDYREGTAIITKMNKVTKRIYGISDKFYTESCNWHGPVKPLYERNSLESMLLDGMYN
jgi:hypothetical protein